MSAMIELRALEKQLQEHAGDSAIVLVRKYFQLKRQLMMDELLDAPDEAKRGGALELKKFEKMITRPAGATDEAV